MDEFKPTISNMQKYENYRIQMGRLSKAMRQEFYLEAMFISYAIIEDRTESILRHSGKFNSKRHEGNQGGLKKKITAIRALVQDKRWITHKYISDELLSDIEAWKDKRNGLIHAMLKHNFEHGEMKSTALEGERLARLLSSKTSSYNKRIDKLHEKEQHHV